MGLVESSHLCHPRRVCYTTIIRYRTPGKNPVATPRCSPCGRISRNKSSLGSRPVPRPTPLNWCAAILAAAPRRPPSLAFTPDGTRPICNANWPSSCGNVSATNLTFQTIVSSGNTPRTTADAPFAPVTLWELGRRTAHWFCRNPIRVQPPSQSATVLPDSWGLRFLWGLAFAVWSFPQLLLLTQPLLTCLRLSPLPSIPQKVSTPVPRCH